jgi:2'-5' RNA ligase
MRLFVGIALPPPVSDALAQVRQRFEPGSGPDLRWPAPEGWHVTLQFLGAVSDERATCVHEQLRTICAAPVPVRIEGLGFFERGGVFWAGVALTAELLALQQRVAAAMRNCGFVGEDRAYNPHITLARAKGRGGARVLSPLKKAVGNNPADLSAEFTAEEFLLYESFPGPEGSRYEVRARFPLTSTP